MASSAIAGPAPACATASIAGRTFAPRAAWTCRARATRTTPALVFGKTAAVRQGAAAKIRDYAEAVILLDPAYDSGGGYRVLGRLHHQTPAVPFFTGWASRSEALKNLRLAVEVGPHNLVGRQFLAEAMWDYEPGRRAEARAMLQKILAEALDPDFLVENRKTQEEAAQLLKDWAGR